MIATPAAIAASVVRALVRTLRIVLPPSLLPRGGGQPTAPASARWWRGRSRAGAQDQRGRTGKTWMPMFRLLPAPSSTSRGPSLDAKERPPRREMWEATEFPIARSLTPARLRGRLAGGRAAPETGSRACRRCARGSPRRRGQRRRARPQPPDSSDPRPRAPRRGARSPSVRPSWHAGRQHERVPSEPWPPTAARSVPRRCSPPPPVTRVPPAAALPGAGPDPERRRDLPSSKGYGS